MNAIFKTGKTILNALAFANADNPSECKALLRRLGEACPTGDSNAQEALLPRVVERPAVAPSIRPVQRAL